MDAQHRPRVLLLGDSITQQSFWVEHQGFGAALTEFYSRAADVVNRGFSGYNTRWFKWILPRLIPESMLERVQLCTIFFGANDSVREGETQHVPLAEYSSNLQCIIRHVRQLAPTAVIVLVTPPTVDTALWPTRSPSSAAAYAEVVREVVRAGNDARLALLDLHELTLDDLRDGLHLNSSGNKKVFSGLQTLLRDQFPELVPKAADGVLGDHFPLSSTFSCKSEEELRQLLTSWEWQN